MTNKKIMPEVSNAVETLRAYAMGGPETSSVVNAINVLENAGVFAAIVETTDCDIDPDPQPEVPWNGVAHWHYPGEVEASRYRRYLVYARTEDGARDATDEEFHRDKADPDRLLQGSAILDYVEVREVRKDPAERGDGTDCSTKRPDAPTMGVGTRVKRVARGHIPDGGLITEVHTSTRMVRISWDNSGTTFERFGDLGVTWVYEADSRPEPMTTGEFVRLVTGGENWNGNS